MCRLRDIRDSAILQGEPPAAGKLTLAPILMRQRLQPDRVQTQTSFKASSILLTPIFNSIGQLWISLINSYKYYNNKDCNCTS